MAAKTEMIRARVTPELKREADALFERLGLSATDAITVFYRQAVLRQGLPFEVRIPNAETRRAIAETKSMRGLLGEPCASHTDATIWRVVEGQFAHALRAGRGSLTAPAAWTN